MARAAMKSHGRRGRNFSITRPSILRWRPAGAEKEGVTSVYSALVNKTVPIEYMDYFRDVASGVTYRVTSNPEEREAPKSAGATIRGLKFFTAERKDLPK